MRGKKDYVSVSKGVHKQKLCNFHELYTAFKEKHPNVNIGFSKFCTLRPKRCVLASSKMTDSICVCSTHQNVVLLVDAMNWDLTYKDLIKKIVCNPDRSKCMMHRCESCPGTATLREFLDQELKEHEDEEFNYCLWDTTYQATQTTIAATYEGYKETLVDVIDDLAKHSYITKCQAQYLK